MLIGLCIAVVVIGVGVAALVIHRRDKAASDAASSMPSLQSFPGAASPASAGSRAAGQSSAQTTASGEAYAPGTYNGSIVTPAADGGARTYVIHIPAGYSPDKTYPLVLVFHGGGGTGARVEKDSGFDTEADAKGFIVVYPNAINGNWDDGKGTTNPNINDVDFVRLLVAQIRSELPINANMVYATGISNGGNFSNWLGCNLASTFAAIGSDASDLPENDAPQCKPSEPISFVGIHGTADPIDPVNGGATGGGYASAKGGNVLSASQTMQFWAGVDECGPNPSVSNLPPTVNDGTSVVQYMYSGCTAGTSVTYYLVNGMGHGWPPFAIPPADAKITGPTSKNINATQVFWDFFAAHSR